MDKKQTKMLIIGSGPAGYSAAIYAERAGLKPIMVSGPQKGGQLTITREIENFPGFPDVIFGGELMERMHQQTINLGTKFVEDIITEVDFSKRPFICKSETGITFVADSVVIATGAKARFLEIPSEKRLIGFGISSCATCDSFFYRNKNVIVVGGGNKAAIEALHLAKITNSVTIVHRRKDMRAEKILQNKLFENPKISFEWNSTIEEFIGTENPTSLKAVKIKNVETGKIKELEVDGVFIAIGNVPQTEIFKNQLELNDEGYIKTLPNSTTTNITGVYAAGDVQNRHHKQAILAAASGALAAMEAEEFLTKFDSK